MTEVLIGNGNLLYFAYGSNMSVKRIQNRVPSAKPLCAGELRQHILMFHKKSNDESGKGDAFYSGDESHCIKGVLFAVDLQDKGRLDRAEGKNNGYDEKTVEVLTDDNVPVTAFTYYATNTKSDLKPYTWYMTHVLIGAISANFPQAYIDKLKETPSIKDPNLARELMELEIYDPEELSNAF